MFLSNFEAFRLNRTSSTRSNSSMWSQTTSGHVSVSAFKPRQAGSLRAAMVERSSCASELSTPEGNVGAACSRHVLAACRTRTSSSSRRTESQSNNSSERCSATVGRTSSAATRTSASSDSRASSKLACARSAHTPFKRPRP